MRFAFLELRDFRDITDLITLLRSGATVGVSAKTGMLFGPARPCQFEVGEGRPGIVRDTFTMSSTSLDTFLADYLNEHHPFKVVRLPDGPDIEMIREAWVILGKAAGIPLPRISILRLAMLIQRWVGMGKVEPQINYGDEGWLELVREGLGHVVLWHRPDAAELQDIAHYGAKGLIIADTASARHSWFEGMSGSFPMPLYGVVDHDPDHDIPAALQAAQGLTLLPWHWDRSRAFMPLCGLLRPFDVDVEAVKAMGWATTRYARSNGIPEPKLKVSQAHPTIDRPCAGGWIDWRWDNLFRVDFR